MWSSIAVLAMLSENAKLTSVGLIAIADEFLRERSFYLALPRASTPDHFRSRSACFNTLLNATSAPHAACLKIIAEPSSANNLTSLVDATVAYCYTNFNPMQASCVITIHEGRSQTARPHYGGKYMRAVRQIGAGLSARTFGSDESPSFYQIVTVEVSRYVI